MLPQRALTSEPSAFPRVAPVRLRTVSRADPPFVRNLPPYARANARLYWENRHQYGGAASSGSVVRNSIQSVLSSAEFNQRWQAEKSAMKKGMVTTVFRNREEPALSITISRAGKMGERLDRVQVLATANYKIGS